MKTNKGGPSFSKGKSRMIETFQENLASTLMITPQPGHAEPSAPLDPVQDARRGSAAASAAGESRQPRQQDLQGFVRQRNGGVETWG